MKTTGQTLDTRFVENGTHYEKTEKLACSIVSAMRDAGFAMEGFERFGEWINVNATTLQNAINNPSIYNEE